jgi:ornithine carbamoyltransferase
VKHFIEILDHEPAELEHILSVSADLKKRLKNGIADRLMLGKTLGMFFEKPSTRTRVSQECAVVSMGGVAINLESSSRLGEREAIRDVARVMSRYVSLLSIRTFGHELVKELARWSDVPVINTLSDYSHPTQAMADIQTMREHVGDTAGKTLTYIGDGNNVARSLFSICAKLGVRFACATPEGYELDKEFLSYAEKCCPKAEILLTNDPALAVKEAAVVYTDVWTSMGQEKEKSERIKTFAPYQVNAELMAKAPQRALVMHCLPAHRGEEITDEVMESKYSVVFDEAENRMHIYRSLFALLLGER